MADEAGNVVNSQLEINDGQLRIKIQETVTLEAGQRLDIQLNCFANINRSKQDLAFPVMAMVTVLSGVVRLPDAFSVIRRLN